MVGRIAYVIVTNEKMHRIEKVTHKFIDEADAEAPDQDWELLSLEVSKALAQVPDDIHYSAIAGWVDEEAIYAWHSSWEMWVM